VNLKRLILGLTLLPILSVGAAPQLVDRSGLDAALKKGDSLAVETLLQEGRINRLSADFARAALRLDFATLAPALMACRDAAYAAEIYAPAVSCGIRLAGAAESEGNPSTWTEAMAWLQDKGLPALRKSYPRARIGIGDGFDSFKFNSIKTNAPQLDLQIAKGARRLEFAKFKTAGSGWLPLIKISVNGKELTAQLDTGASQTLILTEEDAKRLGLSPLVTEVSVLKTSYVTGNAIDTEDSFYVAQSVAIGPLTAKNYLVVGTHRPLPFPVVGSDLLARFDRLSLDSEQLILNPEKQNDCLAEDDMKFASSGKMNGSFVFAGEINGRKATLSLDTGSDSELLLLGDPAKAFSSLPVQSALVSAGGDQREMVFRSAVVPISIGGISLGTVDARILPVPARSADGYLGAPFLDKYRITHDLRAAMICISKR
jgi:predicted aspartyl protease